MSRLTWNEVGERLYETGTRNGVLYLRDSDGKYTTGVAWNGLTGVTQSPSGAEPSPIYADDIKYLTLMSIEEFGATIEAYTYPDEFMICDGSAPIATGIYIGQQSRRTFGFCFRTALGNDVELDAYGYKLHLIYGCIASPSDKAYSTINDSPEAITFSWEITTTPVDVPGFKPTALISIDSTKIDPDKLKLLEDILYGTDEIPEDIDAGTPEVPAVVARLPLPAEIMEIVGGNG